MQKDRGSFLQICSECKDSRWEIRLARSTFCKHSPVLTPTFYGYHKLWPFFSDHFFSQIEKNTNFQLPLYDWPTLSLIFILSKKDDTVLWVSKAIYCLLNSHRKWTKLTILSIFLTQDSESRSFFGRIEETINCFRDLLTFSKEQFLS